MSQRQEIPFYNASLAKVKKGQFQIQLELNNTLRFYTSFYVYLAKITEQTSSPSLKEQISNNEKRCWSHRRYNDDVHERGDAGLRIFGSAGLDGPCGRCPHIERAPQHDTTFPLWYSKLPPSLMLPRGKE